MLITACRKKVPATRKGGGDRGCGHGLLCRGDQGRNSSARSLNPPKTCTASRKDQAELGDLDQGIVGKAQKSVETFGLVERESQHIKNARGQEQR